MGQAAVITIKLISNTRGMVEGDFDPDWLDTKIRYRPSGYQYSKPFRTFVKSAGQKGWDGYAHLLNKTSNTFPIGMLQSVTKHLVRKYKRLHVEDYRYCPAEPVDAATLVLGDKEHGTIKLRPYQSKAVNAALAATTGVVKSATGSGKTEMTAATILALTHKKRMPKALVMVPNRRLLKQTIERLKERLRTQDVGMIGYGKWEEQQVTVCIPDTLMSPKHVKRRRKLMRACELLVIDECHHSKSTSWHRAINACCAYYRIGFSATPLDREDGTSFKLVACTGPIVAEVKAADLIREGYLARPTVEMVEVSAPVLPADLSYEEAYTLGVVRNLRFHRRLVESVSRCVRKKERTIVLVTRLEHGEHLKAVFKDEGVRYRVRFVHAKLEEALIEKRMRLFRKGKIDVLIASPILGEGVDMPEVDVIVNAAGEKSPIRTNQRAGRALRRKKGKPNRCRIIDFNHRTHPDLQEHSEARRIIYEGESFEVVDRVA